MCYTISMKMKKCPMPRVLNKRADKIPEGAVYIGRPSKWGNPFKIGVDGNRETVIELYRRYIQTTNLDFSELKGKDLVCWCSPLPCHGDVLLELANGG